MADTNENIFISLKSIVVSAFIGVVSFQIIAPGVWGYLHEFTKMPYNNAYWWFVWAYLLSVPFVAIILLGYFNEQAKKYLPPFNNKKGYSTKSIIFYWGLIIFIIIEILVTTAAFNSHVTDGLFRIWFRLNLLLCIAFFVFGCRLSYERINHYHIPRLPTAWNQDIRRPIKKLFFSSIAINGIIFIILFAINYNCLKNWIDDKKEKKITNISANIAGDKGFALLELKDTIQDKIDACSKIDDSLANDRFADTLININTIGKFAFDHTRSDSLILPKLTDSLLLGFDTTLLHIGMEIQDSLKTIKKDSLFTASSIKKVATNVKQIKLAITSISNIDAIKNARIYLGLIKSYLIRLNKLVDSASKYQLGIQLRSVQIKGITLLTSFFFMMLSLYIFLKINDQLLSLQLYQMQKNNKLMITKFPDKDVTEKEEDATESQNISKAIMILLTVIIWLLVPFFKTVKDEDIDTKSPYKMLTFSPTANDFVNPKIEEKIFVTYNYHDTVTNIKIDTVINNGGIVRTDTITRIVLDTSVLNAVRKKLDTIRTILNHR